MVGYWVDRFSFIGDLGFVFFWEGRGVFGWWVCCGGVDSCVVIVVDEY